MVDLLWLSLVIFIIPVLLEYSKEKERFEGSIGFLLLGGIFFLLSAALDLEVFLVNAPQAQKYLLYLFESLGWVSLLVAFLMSIGNLLKK